MNYLFIHQNMPGQFGHLAARLAREPGNRVVYLTKADCAPPRGVTRVLYQPTREAHASTHHYLRDFENAVLHGQATARTATTLKSSGFTPDIVVAHPGWGEALYIKDIFPTARLASYCEFYYRAAGADVGFDPMETLDADGAARIRTRNAPLLLALEACDRGFSPTQWQRSVHPPEWQGKIDVIFDGVDAETARPNPQAAVKLPDGTILTSRDQVVTYVARNLEPYRGFPSFMRAVPHILDALPEAHILVVGGDDVSYGRRAAGGRTWRATMMDELALSSSRLHFLGAIPYADYLHVLQISSAHVYLTVPFVLSWSAMEALAVGCVLIGSRTAPVEEVVRDGENGVLVDFFAPEKIAAATVDAVSRRADLGDLRRRARETIIGRYDLATCLPRQLSFLDKLVGREANRLTGAAA